VLQESTKAYSVKAEEEEKERRRGEINIVTFMRVTNP
jgi:hypothetical protein